MQDPSVYNLRFCGIFDNITHSVFCLWLIVDLAIEDRATGIVQRGIKYVNCIYVSMTFVHQIWIQI